MPPIADDPDLQRALRTAPHDGSDLLGTVHVAFGASAAIGGTVSVPVHEDCVVVGARLELDGETVLEDGHLAA